MSNKVSPRMSVNSSDPRIAAVLERAGMLPAPEEVLAQLGAAMGCVGSDLDLLLEVSRALWATETEQEDVLVVLMREAVVLVGMRKGGLFRAPEPRARALQLGDYQYVAESDEILLNSVTFLAPSEDDAFLLGWRDSGERARMFRAIFAAHAGQYSQWGLQLDPADYAADFDRYYALVTAGPEDVTDWHSWLEQEFGDYDFRNALGLAAEWRRAELDDAAGQKPSSRVSRIASSGPWSAVGPEAQRVVLRLGEQLWEEGLLGPPYDEVSFHTDEELTNGDAGPARLVALMTIAAHAKALGHPRAEEWIEAARPGISMMPPKVFSKELRDLWSGIEALPAVDDSPPAEIPIQEDVDVGAICHREGDRVTYSQEGLSEADDELIKAFFMADQRLNQDGPPSGEAVVETCLLGVRAFEGLSAGAPAGWRKLILYAISDLTYDLWEKHRVGDPAAKLAHWVVATIEANHWGPDGRSTPLGQHHSYAMGVAVGTGVGVILIDPETGTASAPTGDEARQAAVAGRF